VTRLIGLWAPVAGFMAAVWFLSDAVSLATPELLSDKLLHLVAYALFGLANLRAFHGGVRRPALAATLAALALTAGFGALDEWRQAGVDFRDASLGDWIADLAGGIAAYVGLHFWGLRRAARSATRTKETR
jgi:VanZ family protein